MHLIFLSWNSQIDLLQDAVKKKCYLVDTEQSFRQITISVSQNMTKSEITLVNDIIIYENKTITFRIKNVIKVFSDFWINYNNIINISSKNYISIFLKKDRKTNL